jgi:hypothetical protein
LLNLLFHANENKARNNNLMEEKFSGIPKTEFYFSHPIRFEIVDKLLYTTWWISHYIVEKQV